MANDIIDIVVTDNSDNVQLNVTPNLVSINVSQTSGNIIGSNYFLASTFSALPITGDTTTLYVINDTSLMYRWSGSAYTQINSSAVVAWGQITGTLSGQTDLQNALNAKAPLASPTFTGTVSGITKSMVGLSNVDNTSDVNKPVSTATQNALDLKAPIASPTFTGTVSGVTKAMVGLSDVDNTSDVNKPISSATQTALDTKAPLASPTFTGTVSGITKSMVGLGNVDNTTDLNKPISTATQTALNLKYDASNPSGYTTNVGTVTSVGGTGTVSGLSLSGTVTTSGNLTLGGTLSLTSGNVTTALGYTPENAANKGVANGYASLDGGGLVPSTQLPSYVDDVLEFADLAAFPASGATGKIYVALDTNKIYRWSGATYIEVSPTVGTIWGGITGTLSNQTDLQNALNAKQDDITLTTTGTSGAATFISNTLNIPNYAPDLSGYVPYTGATTNVNLGTHSLTASDLVINHVSGSGVAASITKGGSGEALTVVKTSGSGNAASITGGVTLLDELHLNTDLADAYIASATNWNTAYTNRITSLTTTGSSGAATLTGNTLNIPQYQAVLTNPVTGTGTTNTVPKFTGASAIGNSNITDSGSLITLGNNTTISSGSLGIGTTSLTGNSLRVSKSITGAAVSSGIESDGVIQSDVTTTGRYFNTSASTSAASFNLVELHHYRAFQGTIGVGSSITDQYGFIVSGTLTGATNNYAFYSNISAATGRWNLFMNGTANNYLAGSLGIGTTNTTFANLSIFKAITGVSSAIYQGGTVQSDITSTSGFRNDLVTQNTAFTLSSYVHYSANQGTIGAGSSVTNQYGFVASSTLTGATNNYGFFGAIAAGTNRWNIYMNGTANNFMAGSLGIGTTALGGLSLAVGKNITGGGGFSFGVAQQGEVQSDAVTQVAGFINQLKTQATTFTAALYSHFYAQQVTIGSGSSITTQVGFDVTASLIGASINYGFRGSIPSGTNRWNLFMNGTANNFLAGNLQIGSQTDAGFKLDVTGTARVSGNATFSSNVGIGTNSPTSLLQVSGATGTNVTPQLTLTNTTTNGYGVLRLVGASRGGFIDFYENSAAQASIVGQGGAFYIYTNGDSSGSPKVTINSGGNVGIGTSSPNSKLQIGSMVAYTGSGYTFAMGNGTTDFLITVNAAQTGSSVTFYSSTDYFFNRSGPSSTGIISAYGFNNVSDYRLKYDLEKFEGLSLVSKIKTYKYKMQETHETQYGVLAHEIQEILPHLVVGVKDGDRMQSVDYQKIVPMLINSIQELSAEINILKNK
jgi:hypothetical protein